MNETPTLVGAVMLEAFWQTRNQDILDLITPFIDYSVSHCTILNDKIDFIKVVEYIRQNFGYKDIPIVIIKRVLNRNPQHYRRRKQSFYLIKSFDNESERLDRKREECIQKINQLGGSLLLYLQSHCQKEHVHNIDQSIKQLQSFFSRYSLSIGLDSIDFSKIQRRLFEADYYTARFILDAKAQGSIEYSYILDLVKGYFLQVAIYLQPQNGNLCTETYKNVTFYYDTPVLIQLLGYQGEEDYHAANQLHTLLMQQKAKFGFFPQTEQEIHSILSAYQHSLINGITSSRTLEGLDRANYNFSDVDRVKKTFIHHLESLSIYRHNIPNYPQKFDGSVDESKVLLDESELKKLILDDLPSYPEHSLSADISSVISTYLLRQGSASANIEKSVAIFVTNNKDLSNITNRYYANSVSKDAFSLVMTANQLAAITWVKSATVDNNMPELQLLRNAYAALQPIPEVMEVFCSLLFKMQNEGIMTKEEAATLRSERVIQHDLLFSSENNPDLVNDNTVLSLRDQYAQEIKTRGIEEAQQKHQQGMLNIYQEQLHQAENIARMKAAYVKNCFLRVCKWIFVFTAAIFFGIAIFCHIQSYSKTWIWWILFIINAISIFDIITARKLFLLKLIYYIANRIESYVFDKAYKEAHRIFSSLAEATFHSSEAEFALSATAHGD